MRWSDMRGDARTRFCEHCKLHVQNLSAMSQRRIARVLARSEHERVCVTYAHRADGTLVTRWHTIVESIAQPFRRGFAWLLAACIPIVLTACQTQSQLADNAPRGPKATPQATPAPATEERVYVTGGI